MIEKQPSQWVLDIGQRTSAASSRTLLMGKEQGTALELKVRAAGDGFGYCRLRGAIPTYQVPTEAN